ncbi:hypothetical protein O5D80_003046 [Batrachochytrium dendrobatidis]|nr:hypothetical protein O5D80_003046 [Batrachochytrium dendrobatidis]
MTDLLNNDLWTSVPGPTYPNRHFFHCATAAGYTANNGAFLGVPCRTIYENMADHGNSYKFYSPQLKSTPLLYRNLRNIYNWMRIKNMSTFFEDARAGSLPQYSFIDPDWLKNDNHPPNNLHAGEQYVKDIYEAIRAGPQWQNTVFVLTYDENGGFYDHVAPPTCVPRPDNINPDSNVGDFQFDRLGPRVPTIIISPYVSKGAVYHSDDTSRFFEHSSIPATLKKLFNLPNFLTPRDAAALVFDDVISLSKPRTDCIQTLPTVQCIGLCRLSYIHGCSTCRLF